MEYCKKHKIYYAPEHAGCMECNNRKGIYMEGIESHKTTKIDPEILLDALFDALSEWQSAYEFWAPHVDLNADNHAVARSYQRVMKIYNDHCDPLKKNNTNISDARNGRA